MHPERNEQTSGCSAVTEQAMKVDAVNHREEQKFIAFYQSAIASLCNEICTAMMKYLLQSLFYFPTGFHFLLAVEDSVVTFSVRSLNLRYGSLITQPAIPSHHSPSPHQLVQHPTPSSCINSFHTSPFKWNHHKARIRFCKVIFSFSLTGISILFLERITAEGCNVTSTLWICIISRHRKHLKGTLIHFKARNW